MENDPKKKFDKKTILSIVAGIIGFIIGYLLVNL